MIPCMALSPQDIAGNAPTRPPSIGWPCWILSCVPRQSLRSAASAARPTPAARPPRWRRRPGGDLQRWRAVAKMQVRDPCKSYKTQRYTAKVVLCQLELRGGRRRGGSADGMVRRVAGTALPALFGASLLVSRGSRPLQEKRKQALHLLIFYDASEVAACTWRLKPQGLSPWLAQQEKLVAKSTNTHAHRHTRPPDSVNGHPPQ